MVLNYPINFVFCISNIVVANLHHFSDIEDKTLRKLERMGTMGQGKTSL